MSSDDELRAMAATLREAGYMVSKIPPCKREGGHGRHGLITRTARCEGAEPMPHGFHSTRWGTFGWWVACTCGHDFADYSSPPSLSPWMQHVIEFGIDGRVASVTTEQDGTE